MHEDQKERLKKRKTGKHDKGDSENSRKYEKMRVEIHEKKHQNCLGEMLE